MRVTRIELTNWGRHKHLARDTDTPVVLLGGPNGTGKTTILDGLDFAFNGDTRDDQVTYVRNHFRPEPPAGATDPEKPANGSVEIDFLKDGNRGTIFRQVGKSPRRWMEWGGKRYTKAGDIEERLKELFGAGKEARKNAIFPPQGSLDKLLFGTPAERQEMFHTLLLLGYMGTVVKVADERRGQILARVHDYTAIHTEAHARHAEAETKFGALYGELGRARDPKPDAVQWEKYLGLCEAAVDADSRRQEAKRNMDNASSEADSLVLKVAQAVGHDPSKGPREVITVFRKIVADLQSTRADLAEYNELRGVADTYATNIARIADIGAEMAAIDSRMPAPDTRERFLALQQRVDGHRERGRLVDQIKARLEPEAAAAKDAAIAQDPPEDPSALKTLLREMQDKRAADNAVLQALENLQSHTGDGKCPVCEHHLEDPTMLQGKTVRLRASVSKLDEMIKVQQQNVATKEREISLFYASMATRKAAWATAETNLEEARGRLMQLPQEPDPAQMLAELEALADANGLARQLEGTKLGLAGELQRLQGAVARVGETTLEKIRGMDPAKGPLLEGRKQALEQKLAGVDAAQVDRLDTLETIAAGLRAAHEHAEENLEAAKKALEDAPGAFSPQLAAVCAGIPEGPDKAGQITAELETRAKHYNELSGRVAEAKAQADACKARLDDIERQIDEDKLRQAVAGELARIKDIFSRQGLPKAYSGYMFRAMTPAVQHNLGALSAGFVVEPDPEEAASYRFLTLNDDGSGWMPQNKMSGGQRVRMSVSFLLALQQIVTPDVGFLVLDEPTTHIDDEGSEAMRDLLTNLSEQLQHTEAQVWVCDHKPELEAAAGVVIRMS